MTHDSTGLRCAERSDFLLDGGSAEVQRPRATGDWPSDAVWARSQNPRISALATRQSMAAESIAQPAPGAATVSYTASLRAGFSMRHHGRGSSPACPKTQKAPERPVRRQLDQQEDRDDGAATDGDNQPEHGRRPVHRSNGANKAIRPSMVMAICRSTSMTFVAIQTTAPRTRAGPARNQPRLAARSPYTPSCRRRPAQSLSAGAAPPRPLAALLNTAFGDRGLANELQTIGHGGVPWL